MNDFNLGPSRRTVLRWALGGGAALTLGGALSACGSGDHAGGSKSVLDSARDKGYISVGYAESPPWSSTSSSGAIVGMSADLMASAFKALGVPKVQGVALEFGQLIPGLLAKRYDATAVSMYIKPDRCQQVSFSQPFVMTGECFAVKPGNPHGIADFSSFATNKGLKLGILSGSAEHEYSTEAGIAEGQLVLFNDLTTATKAVAAGRVDAAAFDTVGIVETIKTQNLDLIPTPDFVPTLNGKPHAGANGFPFRHDDKVTLDAFNGQLQKMVESGEVQEIIHHYIGDVIDKGIAEATTVNVDKLCAG